jgi:hypothetical protein
MDWTPPAAFIYSHPSGETVGPIRCEPASVHDAARQCVTLSGGSATVLERAECGWRAVREYR